MSPDGLNGSEDAHGASQHSMNSRCNVTTRVTGDLTRSGQLLECRKAFHLPLVLIRSMRMSLGVGKNNHSIILSQEIGIGNIL
jgi:hypothetical protein